MTVMIVILYVPQKTHASIQPSFVHLLIIFAMYHVLIQLHLNIILNVTIWILYGIQRQQTPLIAHIMDAEIGIIKVSHILHQ